MTEIETTDQKFLHIESKVAVYLSVAFLGMIVVWFLISKQHHIFSSKKSIYFITESGKNLQSGVNVTFSGFKIGGVKRVTLTDDSKVLVELAINSNYIKRIKKDSKAILSKELPIAESFIEIIAGSKEAAEIEENDFITYVKARWFPVRSDEINSIPITMSLGPEMLEILTNVKYRFKNDIEPMIDNMKFTMENFRNVSKDALVTRQYLDDMYINTNKNLNSLEELMTELNTDIPLLIEAANESVNSIKIMAEDIREVSINAFDELTQMIQEGITITNDAKDISDAVKQVWPISSKIKKKEKDSAGKREVLIRLDSNE